MAREANSALLAALEKTAFRVSLLLRSASHPERNAIGTWTVGETANHLAHCYTAFTSALEGSFSVAPDDVAAHNKETLTQDPERDLDVLADRVDAGAARYARYLEVASGYDQDAPVDFFIGMRVPASSVSATLLGEALIHGYDIARAEGLPWPIDTEHALLTLEGLEPVMVHFVDEDASAGLNACFEVRLRGGPTRYWHCDDGRLTVADSPTSPVDCRISADPLSLMLMSYNRIGPTMPALTGKVVVWGRRPWLALRLGDLFHT